VDTPSPLTIPVKYEEKKIDMEKETGELLIYCMSSGSFDIHHDPVRRNSDSERCDKWELDFVIGKYEKFLESLTDLDNMEQVVSYTHALYSLALLYKQKGEYATALSLVKQAKSFDQKKKLKQDLAKYDSLILDLEKKITEK
jgi:hypothetical protein